MAVVSDGEVSSTEEDNTPHCHSDRLSIKVSGCRGDRHSSTPFDDLDYDEEEEGERLSHARHSVIEDGEVVSDEDGEIREATPPSQTRPRRKSSTNSERKMIELSGSPPPHYRREMRPPFVIPATAGAVVVPANNNVCRHFLQGRCSWGDDCRFLHETPSSSDTHFDDSPTGSPFDPRHSRHLPPPPPPPLGYRVGSIHHLVPIPLPAAAAAAAGRYELYSRSPVDILPPNYPVQHYYSHMRWRLPSPHSTRGGVVPPLASRDKIEESEGWHRLRTVTGWESDEEDRTTSDLRMKLKKKRDASSSSGSESDSNEKPKKKKRKKKKRKEQEETRIDQGKEKIDQGKEKTSRGEEEWIDPWSRKKVTKKDTNDSSDEEDKKTKKSSSKKRKTTPELSSPLKRPSKSDSSTKESSSKLRSPTMKQQQQQKQQEMILKELDRVNKKIEQKRHRNN